MTNNQPNVFSDTEVCFTIRSAKCPNLTLVDLPGWIVNPIPGQSADAPALVEKLIKNYCKDENTIMMCVSSVSNDLATCMGIKICKEIDFDG